MKKIKCHMDKNGRISIPAKIRKILNLKVGNDVLVEYTDSELIVSNFKSRVEKARKILGRYKNLDLHKELILMRSEDEK